MFNMSRDPKDGRPARRWWAIAIALGLAAPVALAAGAAPSIFGKGTEPQPKGRTVVMPVTGMSCVSCAATIKRAVKAMDGVSRVEVSLANRTMEVTYDPSAVSPQQLAATVNDLGYRAGAPAKAK